ncbi:TonB-dependent receptor [Kineobactrum salinum]|uniref:TonB-dependent receptor n=1 Tax=Kineobactrum salinum TaxID=2708301 RepID=A0A6C0U2V2_9GAMM|nr:TonB-dependent receptor [Kineobactrum salinum]QIB66502.1 TonB-dependent receptor [Kineobactrum salinum]
MKTFKYGVPPLIAISLLASVPSVQAAEKAGFALEEVVVTARKREENLQATPIAISAFTERELEVRQIDSSDRLGDVTPNLTFDPVSPSSGSNSAAQIFIRGIGQTDFTPVTDPGVGLYIDGVYMARSVGNVLDFLDVERIEILRGPQGTLFGRNTIGGAVSIHSKRPTDEKSGSIQVQVGNDDMRYLTGKFNMPISDQLLSNFAFASKKRDGYVKRINDGIDTGDDDSLSARGTIQWTPSDVFELYATADATRIRENGAPTVSGGVNDKAAFGTFGNGVLESCDAIVINPDFPLSGPPSFPPPGVGAGGAPGCFGPDTFAGEYRSEGTFPVKSDLDIWGVSAEMTWNVNDWLNMKSITAYREMEMESSRDGDNTPANIFATEDFYDHEQFSQEFQFSGVALADRLQWLFGLYYFQEEGFNLNPVYLPVGAIRSGGLYDNDSKAAFFQTTYDMTDRLALAFGVRYTEDSKRFTPDQISLGDASASGIFSPTFPLFEGFYLPSVGAPLAAGERLVTFAEFGEEFDDTNIMLNLSYQWTDNVMVYSTYSEGFKSGGFDQRFTAFIAAPTSFQPETVESYEIGLKSDLFDNTLRLNIAVFHTDYEDLQIIIREGFNPVTFNGGTADIDGAEVELTWVPTDRWYITGALGYIDARYDELDDSVSSAGTNATPVFLDNELVNTPKLSPSLGIAYTFDLGDWATLTPRVDWSYHDEQENDAVNTSQLHQDSYTLLNAAFFLETNDGRWRSVLAFRNITDEKYLVTGNSAFGTSAAYVEQVYGRPFEWTLSVQYNFL